MIDTKMARQTDGNTYLQIDDLKSKRWKGGKMDR